MTSAWEEQNPPPLPLTCSIAIGTRKQERGQIYFSCSKRLLLADSVEKVASAAACRSSVPAVEVAASHFKLPFGVSLSVLAQV
ncbi:hypothetical protein R4J99_32980, partial [Pseudomonas aeruginosa]|uniref:hypothetical protein n=1 Tax=Pseudomonas aeruginosa TaxID=287 RepID=UPI002954DA3E